MRLFLTIPIIFLQILCECAALGNCLLPLFRKKQNDVPESPTDFDQRLRRLEQQFNAFLRMENLEPSVGHFEKRIERLEKRVESFETQLKAWFFAFDIKQNYVLEQLKQLQQQQQQNQQNHSAPTPVMNKSNSAPVAATTVLVRENNGKMPIFDERQQQRGGDRLRTVSELIADHHARSAGHNLLQHELHHRHADQRSADAVHMPISQMAAGRHPHHHLLESQRSGPSNSEERMDRLWEVHSDDDRL